MYMIYVLIGITVICGLLCMTELLVRVWEKADRRRACVRPVYAPAVPAIRHNNITHISAGGSLPDRESIGKICSLSDHFADRFREVVNS